MALMLCSGERPWLPGTRSTDLEVLLDVDHPLVGTFVEGGATYLFGCLVGDLGRLEVWAYAPLSSDDVDFLRSDPFDTPKDLRIWTDARFMRDAVRAAVSWDGVLQVHADPEEFDGGIVRAVEHLLEVFPQESGFVTYRSRAQSAEQMPLVVEVVPGRTIETEFRPEIMSAQDGVRAMLAR